MKENEQKTYDTMEYIVIGVFFLFLMVALIVSCLGIFDSSGGNVWDKLSDSEKDWYERNYGDGKLDDINNVIKNYLK